MYRLSPDAAENVVRSPWRGQADDLSVARTLNVSNYPDVKSVPHPEAESNRNQTFSDTTFSVPSVVYPVAANSLRSKSGQSGAS